jgi:hypothetical protein
VFFDCRNDLYGPSFVHEYLTVIRAEPGWQQVTAEYALTVALVPVDSPISSALLASTGWRMSYRDGIAAVFTRSK